MQRQADELVTAMNHAAEQAVPEAKSLLMSGKDMSVQYPKGVLTGGDTAATEYFRKTTSAQLRRNSCRSLRRPQQSRASERSQQPGSSVRASTRARGCEAGEH